MNERVTTPNQVRTMVRRMGSLGADWIKTTHTDKSFLLNRNDPPVFNDACFQALVNEARKQNLPVAMHQTWVSGFRKAVELKVNSMEHAPLDALTDEDIGRMVDAHIPIVPTMKVLRDFLQLEKVEAWMNAEARSFLCPESLRQTRNLLRLYKEGITAETAQKGYYIDIPLIKRQFPVLMENVRRLYNAGATLGCGTDSGGAAFTVFGRFYEEIDNLLEAGLSHFEALRCATIVNAQILGIENNLGSLESGKLADFVVLDGNPLYDITALRRIKMVVKEGNILYKENP